MYCGSTERINGAAEILPLHFHVPGTESNSKHPVSPWISIYKSSCYHLQNTRISLKLIKKLVSSHMWEWECTNTMKRKNEFISTFLAASQFTSLIAMGAPRRTTLSTSSAANKQKGHFSFNHSCQNTEEAPHIDTNYYVMYPSPESKSFKGEKLILWPVKKGKQSIISKTKNIKRNKVGTPTMVFCFSQTL